jgi:uncharacterized protein
MMGKADTAWRGVVSLAWLMGMHCAAQEFDFGNAAVADPATLSKQLPELAKAVIAVYRDDDRAKYLDNLFRLQIVAGRYADAAKTLADLRTLRTKAGPPQSAANIIQYEIFAKAKAESENGSPFEETFSRVFRERFSALDDRTSALVIRAIDSYQSPLQQRLNQALEQQKSKNSISLSDALILLRAYQIDQTYRSLRPLAAPLFAEDDHRRYIIDQDIQIRTPDNATICVMVIRPRSLSGRLPTLLSFTIYADPSSPLEVRPMLDEARRAASNGYAAVVGLTRGKGCSPDKPIPYEHDGADAAVLIDWISAQDWSDHRVGMYGGSYSGYTAWAAAKRMPKPLKAIAVGAPVAPAIDVPMEGNVFENFVYPWPFYTTNNQTLDNATYNDTKRWDRLNHDWYVSGRAYCELDKIDGTPNPIFRRWIAHPSYDAYWQSLIPYKKDFARIKIPVLETAGYFSGGPGAATYYFTEHYKYNPSAEHYFLIGPYDHFTAQTGTIGLLSTRTVISGYELDPVAHIDMVELRYQWFDYIFKGAPKPALLQDRVNYQVMGANVWKHARSLAAMANQKIKLYLNAARSGNAFQLTRRKPAGSDFINQTVDLANRTDVDRISPASTLVGSDAIVSRKLEPWNSLEFVSDRFPKPIEVSGFFSGRLDFVANKKDFDFCIQFYELTPQGDYVLLLYYMQRASYAHDRSQRRLLTPGQRTRLDFNTERITSRQFQAGSRLIVMLGIIKQPDIQINYGTGKDVSDETIADAKEPVKIEWFNDSFVDIPVRR